MILKGLKVIKAKTLGAFMLYHQYTYYSMRHWDKQLGLSVSFTQGKALTLASTLDACILVISYLFTGHLLLHQKMIGEVSFKMSSFMIGYLACASILWFINKPILGSATRIQHYNNLFNGWDKWKLRRWSFYSYAVPSLIFALLFIELEIDQNGLKTNAWINDITNAFIFK